MIKEVDFWNPNQILLTTEVAETCDQCQLFSTFRDLPIDLPDFRVIPVFSR